MYNFATWFYNGSKLLITSGLAGSVEKPSLSIGHSTQLTKISKCLAFNSNVTFFKDFFGTETLKTNILPQIATFFNILKKYKITIRLLSENTHLLACLQGTFAMRAYGTYSQHVFKGHLRWELTVLTVSMSSRDICDESLRYLQSACLQGTFAMRAYGTYSQLASSSDSLVGSVHWDIRRLGRQTPVDTVVGGRQNNPANDRRTTQQTGSLCWSSTCWEMKWKHYVVLGLLCAHCLG